MTETRYETVFGPPGTGKTTTFTRRIRALLEDGAPPERICAATFTRMAAQEFRSRLRRDLNLDDDDMAWMRTLHSLAWRLLGMDRLRLANTHFKEFEQTYPQFPMSDRKTARVNEDLFEPLDEQESDGRKGDVLLGIWTYVRNRNGHDVMEAASRGQFPSNVDYTPFEVSTFVGVYEAWKQENNFLDFTDLLMRVLTERIAPPTQMFLLDEAQDMTPLQWAVWDRWVAGADYVGLFGDDDQTLYEFMGARPQEFLERAGRGTARGARAFIPLSVTNCRGCAQRHRAQSRPAAEGVSRRSCRWTIRHLPRCFLGGCGGCDGADLRPGPASLSVGGDRERVDGTGCSL